MATGKLYQSHDESLIGGINYEIKNDTDGRWWGELTMIDYVKIKDGPGYIIEIEDGRRCRCSLKKRVNRAVTSLPPRYVYHVSGSGNFT